MAEQREQTIERIVSNALAATGVRTQFEIDVQRLVSNEPDEHRHSRLIGILEYAASQAPRQSEQVMQDVIATYRDAAESWKNTAIENSEEIERLEQEVSNLKQQILRMCQKASDELDAPKEPTAPTEEK